ncbi:MAG: hypothetical protein HYX68_28030 [Planctomycetes bacterium]|nr:hypothetical protein [Planctomycetota bacterium]
MLRLFIVSLILSMFFIGATYSAPARPVYEPEAPTARPAMAFRNLNGTAWLGKYITTNRTFILEADGTVSYKTTTKTVFRNRGTWRLDGNTLFFEHWINPKSKLLQFRGTVTDSDTIVGEQTILRTGARINTNLQRTVVPPR